MDKKKQRAFPWAREQRKVVRNVWEIMKEERQLKRERLKIDGRLFFLERARVRLLRAAFPAASHIEVEIREVGNKPETLILEGARK